MTRPDRRHQVRHRCHDGRVGADEGALELTLTVRVPGAWCGAELRCLVRRARPPVVRPRRCGPSSRP
jgi:hypothetical protein